MFVSISTYLFKIYLNIIIYMEKKSDKEKLFLMDKDSEMNIFLSNFIKTLDIIDEEEDLIDMTTSNLLLESIDKDLDIEEFTKLINQKNFKDKFTGLFLCGFSKNDDISIIRLIEKHNGIYNVKLNCHISESEYNNEIYAAFESPIYAYKCFIDIDNINTNNEIEDLSYLL